MKTRILTAAVLMMAMVFTAPVSVAAAESDIITFDGNAKEFVTSISGDMDNGFEGMLPGETRTMKMELSNESVEELNFFMSSDILTVDIAEQGDKRAVYDFAIAADGEEFFRQVIGGEGEQNISAGKEYLTKDHNILLAALKKGEKTTIEISMMLDGDSTDNAYMGAAGKLTFRFSAETAEEAPTIKDKEINKVPGKGNTEQADKNDKTNDKNDKTDKSVKTAKTGDTAFTAGYLSVAAGSLFVIIAVLANRRKNRVEGKS